MTRYHQPQRRRFLAGNTAGSSLLTLDSLIPAWARNIEVAEPVSPVPDSPLVFDLEKRERALEVPPLVMVNAKYYGWRVALYIGIPLLARRSR